MEYGRGMNGPDAVTICLRQEADNAGMIDFSKKTGGVIGLAKIPEYESRTDQRRSSLAVELSSGR
jgi:hypothetical protein